MPGLPPGLLPVPEALGQEAGPRPPPGPPPAPPPAPWGSGPTPGEGSRGTAGRGRGAGAGRGLSSGTCFGREAVFLAPGTTALPSESCAALAAAAAAEGEGAARAAPAGGGHRGPGRGAVLLGPDFVIFAGGRRAGEGLGLRCVFALRGSGRSHEAEGAAAGDSGPTRARTAAGFKGFGSVLPAGWLGSSAAAGGRAGLGAGRSRASGALGGAPLLSGRGSRAEPSGAAAAEVLAPAALPEGACGFFAAPFEDLSLR